MTLVKMETKNGGPYSTAQRDARRAEVYRLHIELGYPITRIADLMNVNPNTISSDVNILYRRLKGELCNLDLDSWLLKQIHRLEIQRTRMHEELRNIISLAEKLAIEKMLLDIDSRILQTVTKVYSAKVDGYEQGIKNVNRHYESEKINKRIVTTNSILCTSEDAQQKILKIIKEDEDKRKARPQAADITI